MVDISKFSDDLADLTSEEIFELDKQIAIDDGVVRDGNMPLYHRGSEHGVLLIHGFTASPHEMSALANKLIACGFSVYNARVAGHGVTLKHMATKSCGDWYNSIKYGYYALKNSCETITVIGQSNGGVLATAVALNNETNALGLLAPAFKVKSPLFKYMGRIKGVISGIPRFLPKEMRKHNYNYFPTHGMHEMLRLQECVNPRVSEITEPVYLAISKIDILVSTSFALKMQDQMPSLDKTRHVYNNAEHKVLHVLTEKRMVKQLEDTASWVKKVNNVE